MPTKLGKDPSLSKKLSTLPILRFGPIFNPLPNGKQGFFIRFSELRMLLGNQVATTAKNAFFSRGNKDPKQIRCTQLRWPLPGFQLNPERLNIGPAPLPIP